MCHGTWPRKCQRGKNDKSQSSAVTGIQHMAFQLKCSSLMVISSTGTFTRVQQLNGNPEMEIRRKISSASALLYSHRWGSRVPGLLRPAPRPGRHLPSHCHWFHPLCRVFPQERRCTLGLPLPPHTSVGNHFLILHQEAQTNGGNEGPPSLLGGLTSSKLMGGPKHLEETESLSAQEGR